MVLGSRRSHRLSASSRSGHADISASGMSQSPFFMVMLHGRPTDFIRGLSWLIFNDDDIAGFDAAGDGLVGLGVANANHVAESAVLLRLTLGDDLGGADEGDNTHGIARLDQNLA